MEELWTLITRALLLLIFVLFHGLFIQVFCFCGKGTGYTSIPFRPVTVKEGVIWNALTWSFFIVYAAILYTLVGSGIISIASAIMLATVVANTAPAWTFINR